jgi:hypothetical protein
MELTIAEVTQNTWKAGILHNNFKFTNGATGICKAGIYRTGRFNTEMVTIYGIGWRNFALASMHTDWIPQVGDTVKVHQNQL